MPGFRFLDLPAELRVAVYSYIVPPNVNKEPSDADPAPYSLRLVCRLVKSEFDQEVETAITKYVDGIIRTTDLPGLPKMSAQPMKTFTRHL
ncbi:hypothetical protein K491DRAFT_722829 [Lophiostoma macrostomum CBS 122681]|uniref:Uncharacterized protein n=1 Tax=Lophiostoma macrostomum CBS 122681 TaxID=1314788 RepID=A0A6A6SJX7_9PLEO|nr:hypothetical protein K491DRAFT_722829 [Lophiostoma macrostomum CBS 122681]